MDWKLYFGLSFPMFLEYAVWGAWAPVLAARLLGPLKMTGKQTGWIYATLPLACIVSPLIAGQLADKYLHAEWILAACHLAGAVLLFAAARLTRFRPLFVVMLIYSAFYAATLPLVNAVLFANVTDVGTQSKVFIWAPVAWALVGYFLSAWRWVFKTGKEGRDCLYLAAVLSIVMAIGCLLLVPETPPAKKGQAIIDAMAMLKEPNFFVFMLTSLVVVGLMQFYFLGTAPFMQDMGIAAKNVPASMAIAQAVQAAATFFALEAVLGKLGFKWTLVVGAGCWLAMYVIYIQGRPKPLIVASQSLHGLAYVFFVIVGQIFAANVASEEIRSSMQALIFAVTTGLGLFLGTQFAGAVMDKFRKEQKFQWRTIFMVPAITAAICIVVLAVLFRAPSQ